MCNNSRFHNAGTNKMFECEILWMMWVKHNVTEYNLISVSSSLDSFMANLGRMAAHEYIPTDQDVLRVRVPTTGINDYSFTVDKISLR